MRSKILRAALITSFALIFSTQSQAQAPQRFSGPLFDPADLTAPSEIADALEARDFAHIEARLRALRDAGKEDALTWAFGDFDVLAPEQKSLVDEWVEAVPDSAAARIVLGTYEIANAWTARSGAYAYKLTEEQRAGMRRHCALARAHLEQSIAIDPRWVQAYIQLHIVARMTNNLPLRQSTIEEGMRVDPYHYGLWATLMDSTEPKWGGSYEAYVQLSEEAMKNAVHNPRLMIIRGYPFGLHASAAWNRAAKRTPLSSTHRRSSSLTSPVGTAREVSSTTRPSATKRR